MNYVRLKPLVLSSVSCLAAAGALLVSQTAHAACTPGNPYGLIASEWESLGGATGIMGACENNVISDGAGGQVQQFANGYIEWTPGESQAFACSGANGEAWISEYGGAAASGPLLQSQYPYPNNPAMGDICAFQIRSGEYAGAYTFIAGGGYAVYGSIGLAWSGSLNQAETPGVPLDNATWNGAYQIQQFAYVNISFNSATGGTCIYNNGTYGRDRTPYVPSPNFNYYHWSGGACGSPPLP